MTVLFTYAFRSLLVLAALYAIAAVPLWAAAAEGREVRVVADGVVGQWQ